MTSKRIDLYWDLGSTNSYFAIQLLKPIAARHNAQIHWHPFNLGYVFQRQDYVLMDESKAKLRNRRDDLNRWAKRYGLPFAMPTQFPIKTSRALRGALAMRQWDKEEAFIDAIFAAYWEHDCGDIGGYQRLGAIAAELGVPAADFVQAAESDEVRTGLIESTNQALEDGIFGAPSIKVGDELYWGKDRMEFIDDQLAQL